ncbi:GNAT family N-acetyltransferase [Luteolibacter sp. GHJ8]|uniref:GNAT family N-acetyltransferase n=1 Tax=Luteolibacter rhizosphaerae TaxID=2989719 RepID=A0ABT3GA83_9BACT|nr:GNAT family N-acetyltransferase [Luteolibacter rhizosphaerae]
MNEIETRIEDDCPDEVREQIVRSLVAYNDANASPQDYRDLVVVSRLGGEVVGGLIGFTHWNWLFIKQLWVSESVRGRGVGTELMRAAEREAVARACLHAHLDTFGFQALPFYQGLGYSVFGQLGDYPVGHTRYFLQKRDLKAGEV